MSNTIFLIGVILLKGDLPWWAICVLLIIGIFADILKNVRFKFK